MQPRIQSLQDKCHHLAVLLACLLVTVTGQAADDGPTEPQAARHRVTGLFSPDRQDDLRKIVNEMPGVKLVSIDYESTEALFAYDAAEVFPNATPEQVIERLDNMLRQASRHTFGVKPLLTVPHDRLERIEIPVAGLDCKGCSLGAYDAIYRIEGVERATVSFKEGRVIAWIDPDQTDRAELEAALMKKGVSLPAR